MEMGGKMSTVSSCASICGFVVDTGCQFVVLDRNIDIEKSD